MSLKIMSIASGSHGNCTYISSETTHILVDAGVNLKRISDALKTIGVGITDLSGVVVTHEHDDHISGLSALSNAGVKVYAHERVMPHIARRIGPIPFENVDFFDAGFEIGDIAVYPFRIPHDTVYPLAYTFVSGGARVSVATDIGHITEGILSNLKGSQVVLLEANHDVEMLMKGSYTQRLKTRISGANGHISNDCAANVATVLAHSGLKTLILGHMSEENNCPELAFSTVLSALDANGFSDKVRVELAYQNKCGEYVDAYVQAIKEAGNLWGVPVIDFNSVTGMNPMIEEQLIYFYDSGYDRLHPNTNGQERMAHTLMYQLLSLPASF